MDTDIKNLWRLTKSTFGVLGDLIGNGECYPKRQTLQTLKDDIEKIILEGGESNSSKHYRKNSTRRQGSSETADTGITEGDVEQTQSKKRRAQGSEPTVANNAYLVTRKGAKVSATQASHTKKTKTGAAPARQRPTAYSHADHQKLKQAATRVLQGKETRLEAAARLADELGRSQNAVVQQLHLLLHKKRSPPHTRRKGQGKSTSAGPVEDQLYTSAAAGNAAMAIGQEQRRRGRPRKVIKLPEHQLIDSSSSSN